MNRIITLIDDLDRVHDMLRDSFPRDGADPSTEWNRFHQAKTDELGDIVRRLAEWRDDFVTRHVDDAIKSLRDLSELTDVTLRSAADTAVWASGEPEEET